MSKRERIFSDVYKNKKWGEEDGSEFCSGNNSFSNTVVVEYCDLVVRICRELMAKTVLEIGVGDFYIGQQLTERMPDLEYVGVDICRELIDYNRQHHGAANIRFLHKDACEDDLPEADIVLVKQVLQHLSNSEVQRVIVNLANYQHRVITEHQMTKAPLPENIDISTGGKTRVDNNSKGLFLEEPPFNLNVERIEELGISEGWSPGHQLCVYLWSGACQLSDSSINDT